MNRYDYIYQINWPGPRNYVPAGEVNEGGAVTSGGVME